MKLTGIAEMGKECLAEYESHLKVHGVKKFDWDAKEIKQRVDVNIDRLNGPDDIKHAILSVLDHRYQEAADFFKRKTVSSETGRTRKEETESMKAGKTDLER